eukprot:gene2824-3620_t
MNRTDETAAELLPVITPGPDENQTIYNSSTHAVDLRPVPEDCASWTTRQSSVTLRLSCGTEVVGLEAQDLVVLNGGLEDFALIEHGAEFTVIPDGVESAVRIHVAQGGFSSAATAELNSESTATEIQFDTQCTCSLSSPQYPQGSLSKAVYAHVQCDEELVAADANTSVFRVSGAAHITAVYAYLEGQVYLEMEPDEDADAAVVEVWTSAVDKRAGNRCEAERLAVHVYAVSSSAEAVAGCLIATLVITTVIAVIVTALVSITS